MKGKKEEKHNINNSTNTQTNAIIKNTFTSFITLTVFIINNYYFF